MPQGFQIGPLTIRYYAIIIMTGALLGCWLVSRLAKRAGKDPEIVWDVLPWLLIGGIIGARLWHVFTPSASNAAMGLTTHYYLTHPLEIAMIWKGGLGIPGGVIGGVIALLIYTKIRKESFLDWADFIAPGLLIGQAIGRWGNFVNQEVYGGPSNLPWAISIDPLYRLPGFENVEKYHPLFLYESILNFIAAGVLVLIHRKWKKKFFTGDIFLLYLVLYPTIRFFLEFLRLDPSPVAGFNINQSFMGLIAIVSALILVYRHFIHPPKQVETVEEVGAVADAANETLESAEEVVESGQSEIEAAGEKALEVVEQPVDAVEEPITVVNEAAEAIETAVTEELAEETEEPGETQLEDTPEAPTEEPDGPKAE